MIIRAEPGRVMTLDNTRLPTARDEDRRGAFITDAALHLINQQSCQSLAMNMYTKYKDDKEMIEMVNTDIPTFRPTFVINEEMDEPYCEDEFQELRIANIMFRQIGPCIRCKTTSLNGKLNIRHPNMEPYTTIC